MAFQVDISLSYNAHLFQWTAFTKFDCPIKIEGLGVVQSIMTEAATFQEALDNLKESPSFKRYLKLLQDNEEGASQNAEGLVN